MGIGDERPTHSNEIGMAIPQDLICLLRGSDPADSDHGDIYSSPDRCGQRNKHAFGRVVGRLIQIPRSGDARRDMNSIRPMGLQSLGNDLRIVSAQPTGQILIC
jgi:hypothetical protein